MLHPALALLIFAAVILFSILVFRRGKGWYWLLRKNLGLNERVLKEDALKYLAHCALEDEPATLKGISGSIDASVGTATGIVSQLSRDGLLIIEGAGYRLTDDGMAYGLQMIRAHRLYETYLSEKTGFTDSEWHDRAERKEHKLNTQDIQQLDRELSYPVYDPHGDPIPTADGKFHHPEGIMDLGRLARGATGTIFHMEDEPREIYSQLVAEGLYPGLEIQVTETGPERIRFWSRHGEHVLAPLLAANVQIVPRPDRKKTGAGDGEPQAAETASDSGLAEGKLSPSLSLAALPAGRAAVIRELSPRISGSERRRLMDLGFLAGTPVEMEYASAGGDPIAYRIKDSLIALRKSQAELIITDAAPVEAGSKGKTT